ncbi:hypothetical protein RDV89_00305 [Nocardioides zeae]|uniref:Uncharacterized protein n=1 Tax=Nocardioides imazamoxiresistens TaxID=3231893 RepID=A0ABU3PRH7_9ACTN|nr:hypothetical protein [Nocardioides zeae]MDT9591486.1 hypothetical protein [Nocardioides zeae]
MTAKALRAQRRSLYIHLFLGLFWAAWAPLALPVSALEAAVFSIFSLGLSAYCAFCLFTARGRRYLERNIRRQFNDDRTGYLIVAACVALAVLVLPVALFVFGRLPFPAVVLGIGVPFGVLLLCVVRLIVIYTDSSQGRPELMRPLD